MPAEEYEILENGKLAERDFGKSGLYGFAAISYYFEDMQNMITYVSSDASPILYYYEDAFIYDTAPSIGSSLGTFRIAKVEDNQLYIVGSGYSFDDGESCNVLYVYSPATEKDRAFPDSLPTIQRSF